MRKLEKDTKESFLNLQIFSNKPLIQTSLEYPEKKNPQEIFLFKGILIRLFSFDFIVL